MTASTTRVASLLEFAELHIANNRHDVAVNPPLDLIGATQARGMYFDVLSSEVIDGHFIASTTGIAAIGDGGFGIESKGASVGERGRWIAP
jgi:hypothetical protein